MCQCFSRRRSSDLAEPASTRCADRDSVMWRTCGPCQRQRSRHTRWNVGLTDIQTPPLTVGYSVHLNFCKSTLTPAQWQHGELTCSEERRQRHSPGGDEKQKVNIHKYWHIGSVVCGVTTSEFFNNGLVSPISYSLSRVHRKYSQLAVPGHGITPASSAHSARQ